MEGGQERRECRPKRCYQCNRLEDQLWETAYDRVWPIVRVVMKERLEAAKQCEQRDRSIVAKGA